VVRTTVGGGRLGEDGSYVVVAVPLDDGGYVVAARSLETVEVAMASTLRLLAIGIPGVLVLTGALSWALAGRALRPVEDLRRRASEITVTGTDARLPLSGTGDEIERLADTLNAMLARLDDSARAQRQFVADASHELRSPVAAIRTVMEVAPPASEVWEEARRDVLGETSRLAHLIDGLLLLARRDAASESGVSRRPVLLHDIVAEQAERPRRVGVETRYRDEPLVLGDPRALGVAVANLLDNASRHAKGSVIVEVYASARDAVVTVTDDGNGIPYAERDRVFERFVRLDDARSRDVGGAGLGLAITRAVAEDHCGTVRVADHPGGARLVLEVPLYRR
jgi:signal transduction histidine kinase